MHTLVKNPTNGQSQKIQKGVQVILDEQGLWLAKGVCLSCDQPKCAKCHTLATYTVCVKGCKCDFCKETKKHSGRCT